MNCLRKFWYKGHWCDLSPAEHRIFEKYEKTKEFSDGQYIVWEEDWFQKKYEELK